MPQFDSANKTSAHPTSKLFTLLKVLVLFLFAGHMQDAFAITSCGPLVPAQLFSPHRVCVDVNRTDFEPGDTIIVTGWTEVLCNRFNSNSYCIDPFSIYLRDERNFSMGSGDPDYRTGKFTMSYFAGDPSFEGTKVGNHVVKAHTSFFLDSPGIAINIRPKQSVSTLASSATSVKIGEPFTLKATVSGYSLMGEGSIKSLINSQYFDIYTETMPFAGISFFPMSTTFTASRAGTYVFAAGFTPSDGNNYGSLSQNLAVTVLPGDTTATLSTANSTPVVAGTPVTLVADLAGYGNSMTGTVNFYDGDEFLGSNTVTNKQAALTTTHISRVGSHLLRAQYGGDANYNGSTSANLSLEVAKAQAVTTLSSSANPVNAGSLVTLSAHVAAGVINLTPTGSVSFLADGVAIQGCEAVPLQNGDAACSSTKLKAGTRQIVASYGGDSNLVGAQSAPLAQVVRNLVWLPAVLDLLLN